MHGLIINKYNGRVILKTNLYWKINKKEKKNPVLPENEIKEKRKSDHYRKKKIKRKENFKHWRAVKAMV